MARAEAAGHVRVGKSSPQPSGAEGGNVRYALIYPPLAAGEYKRQDTWVVMAGARGWALSVGKELEAAGHVGGEGRARANIGKANSPCHKVAHSRGSPQPPGCPALDEE